MANTFTTKFRLAKPEVGVLDWHLYYYDAMNIIDAHIPRIMMSAPLIVTIAKSAGGSLTDTQYYFYRITAMDGTLTTQASWEDWREQADGTNKTITVNWSAVAGATKYRVYRADTSDGAYIPVDGDYTLLAEVLSGTEYIDDGTVVPSGVMPTVPTWEVTEIKQSYLIGDTTEAQTQHATPATLVENMNNLRYMLDAIVGQTNWDDAPTTNLEWIGSGKAGGQTLTGGTASGEDLTIRSTAHATKGTIFMDSELDLQTHKIVNLVDPLNPQEAATKQYVDNYVVSGGWVEYRESFIVGTASGNYTGSTTVFALLNNYVTNGKNADVFYDGVKQRQGASYDYLETDGFTITFNSARVAGRTVTIEWGRGAAPASVINERRDNFTATTGQTVFDLSFTYLTGGKNLKVYVDGVLMTITDDYVETDTDTVTFVTGMSGGEKVSFLWGDPVASGDAEYLNSIAGSATPEANKYLSLDSDAKFPADILTNNADRNMFINGGCEKWLGGTYFLNPDYAYVSSADGWLSGQGTTSGNTIIFERSTDTAGNGGTQSLKFTANLASSAQEVWIGQMFTRQGEYSSYVGKKLSVSIWLKGVTGGDGNGFVVMTSDNIAGTTVQTGFVPYDDVWRKYSFTYTVPVGCTTFSIWVGNQDIDAAEAGTVLIDDAMCVLGSEAVDYVPTIPREEEASLYAKVGYENARNLIDNGSMYIWQRGTGGFSDIGNGQFLCDRWEIKKNNCTVNGGRASGEGGLNYSMDFSPSAVSPSAFMYAQQLMENWDLYKNREITFAIKAKFPGSGGPYHMQISDGVWSTLVAGTGDDLWHTYVIKHRVYSNPSYLNIYIGALGPGYGEPVVSNHVVIEYVTAVLGRVACYNNPTPPALDLERCQRHYSFGTNPGGRILFTGDVTNGQTYYGVKEFPVHMKATPTVTLTHQSATGFPLTAGPGNASTQGIEESRVANATVAGHYVSGWTAECT